MPSLKACTIALALVLASTPTLFADVQLTMRDGRVSLVAKDATLRQILSEWAKVGQTRIVNADRVPGGPVTLQLNDVPERDALDVLLRSLSGYLAAPRRTAPAENQSRFDRIVVMPTMAPPPSATRSAAPVATPTQTFPQPGGPMPFSQQLAQPNGAAGEDDQDEDRPQPPPTPQPGRGPVFNTFPQPQVVNPAQPQSGGVQTPQAPLVLPPPGGAAPADANPTTTGVPIGVSTPGMAVPVPQAPQPNTPGVPPQRRPGSTQPGTPR